MSDPQSPLPAAPLACESCKKRKKACNKALPSCARCSRLLIRCSYPCDSKENEPVVILPPLLDIFDDCARPTPVAPAYHRILLESKVRSLSINEEIHMRAVDCLAQNNGNTDVFCPIYFKTFHKSLPLINEDEFQGWLQHFWTSQNPHFSTLLVSVFLVTRLTPQTSTGGDTPEELYSRVKCIYSMLLATGKLSIELVQAGILIAAYEHQQDLQQQAWLSIGACARVAQVLGYHELLRNLTTEERKSHTASDTRRCVWWCIVILERVIGAECHEHRLPYTSGAPEVADILPLTKLDGDLPHRVADDLILPGTSKIAESGLHSRGFTRFGPFASSVQSTYLLSLVTRYVLRETADQTNRQVLLMELDTVLHSFASSMIPPPGEAHGEYCGGYGMFANSHFLLHQGGLSADHDHGHPSLSILALQSMARIIIAGAKAGTPERPLEQDEIAFWAHRACYTAALSHIKFGQRDESWAEDLEALKNYLRYLEPRSRLVSRWLQNIETTKRCHIKPEPDFSTKSEDTIMQQ